jgi:hypothetical protein
MRVRFDTVEEFLEELQLAVETLAQAMAPCILRRTCTYTPGQGQTLHVTVVAGVLIHQQLIELQHDCGTVWDRPGSPESHKSRMKPIDEQTYAKVTTVLSAIEQFATAPTWAVRKGIFVP